MNTKCEYPHKMTWSVFIFHLNAWLILFSCGIF